MPLPFVVSTPSDLDQNPHHHHHRSFSFFKRFTFFAFEPRRIDSNTSPGVLPNNVTDSEGDQPPRPSDASISSESASSSETVVEDSASDALTANTSKSTPRQKSRITREQVVQTSVNALLFTLKSVITHIPAPGLSAAVEGLVECIERCRIICGSPGAIDELKERMLAIHDAGGMKVSESKCAERLQKALETLSRDLELASRTNRFVKFLNARDDEAMIGACNSKLDSIMSDLNVAISTEMYTYLQKNLTQKASRRARLGVSVDGSKISTMGRTGSIFGNFGYRNKGDMYFEAEGAVINTGGGHLFSENTV